jgi:hypothetical protein
VVAQQEGRLCLLTNFETLSSLPSYSPAQDFILNFFLYEWIENPHVTSSILVPGKKKISIGCLWKNTKVDGAAVRQGCRGGDLISCVITDEPPYTRKSYYVHGSGF